MPAGASRVFSGLGCNFFVAKFSSCRGDHQPLVPCWCSQMAVIVSLMSIVLPTDLRSCLSDLVTPLFDLLECYY